jgi:hypothetical protein
MTPPKKTGTKVIRFDAERINFVPQGNHAGEVMLWDFVDNPCMSDCNIGPATQDGSTVTHGVKADWVQYAASYRSNISVNGAAFYINMPQTATENEYNWFIQDGELGPAKVRNLSFDPCVVFMDVELGRSAAMYRFVMQGRHSISALSQVAGGAYTPGREVTAGIRIKRSHQGRIFHCAQIQWFWEYMAASSIARPCPLRPTHRRSR